MATDQSEPSAAELGAGPEREHSEPLGIAHLTVVPENADRSS